MSPLLAIAFAIGAPLVVLAVVELVRDWRRRIEYSARRRGRRGYVIPPYDEEWSP